MWPMTECEECCKVYAILTVDSRGQIVLPKEIRDRAKIEPNDRLAVIGCEYDGELCCLVMIKADRLGEAIKDALRPMLKEFFK